MVFISGAVLLTKSAALVIFGLVSRKLIVAYFVVDVGLYLLLKILRDDFYYWIPVDGFVGLLVSFLIRIIIKFIADFSSIGK